MVALENIFSLSPKGCSQTLIVFFISFPDPLLSVSSYLLAILDLQHGLAIVAHLLISQYNVPS